MIVTKSRTSIVLFTFLSQIHLFGATLTIGKSLAEVKTSDTFSITCHVSDLSDAVVFYRGTIEVGRCAKSVFAGFPGLCLSGFSQDITTNITTYSIASANATTEDGPWTCQHTTETSNTLTITVYGFLTNPVDDNQAYLPNSIDTTVMDSTQLTVNVSECVNPAPTISWSFYEDCDGNSITPIPITSTTSEDQDVFCSSPYSAYKSIVTVTDMKNKVNGDYCYKVRVLVGYPGTSFTDVTRIFTQNLTFILIAVLLILTFFKLFGIIIGCGFLSHCISHAIIWILRHLKIKKCKYPVQYILKPSVGETAELEIDRTLVLAYRADSRNISSKEKYNKVIFSINLDSDKKDDVYHIDILVEDFEDKDKIQFQKHVTPKTTPTDYHLVTPKITPADDHLVTPKTTPEDDHLGGLIKFQLQFHPNNGDFVTIKDSDKYMFADKCTICGMTFRSMQIIIAAAVNQLVTIIPTVIVLAVVYCYYRKFDRCHAALLVVASAVVFPILNIGVYMLTVLCCCRKLKSDSENEDDAKSKLKSDSENEDDAKSRFRSLRTALLIMMHILPVAWFVLIVIIIVKRLREKSHNEEQNNTENHKMGTGKKGGDNLTAHGHRRLPPITVPTLNGTDEQNENTRKKKKSKKDKKAKQITNSPGNIIHPMEIQNAEQLSEEIVQPCITDLK